MRRTNPEEYKPYLPNPPDYRPVAYERHSSQYTDRTHYRKSNHGRSGKNKGIQPKTVVWLAAGAVAVAAIGVGTIVEKVGSAVDKVTASPFGPVYTSAVFTNPNYVKGGTQPEYIKDFARYQLDPKLLTRNKKTHAIGIGVEMILYGPDYPLIAKLSKGGLEKTIQDTSMGSVMKFMGTYADRNVEAAVCTDLMNITKMAINHADVMAPAGSAVTAAQLRATESVYQLAPYTTTRDNPNIVNSYVYYEDPKYGPAEVLCKANK